MEPRGKARFAGTRIDLLLLEDGDVAHLAEAHALGDEESQNELPVVAS